jgi:type I restriction enzyme M protein
MAVKDYGSSDDIVQQGIQAELIKIKDNRIYYLEQQKDYDFSDPEEKVRARVYCDLVLNHGYPNKRIDFEVLPPARVPPYPADIVVFREDEKIHAYIVVEVKPTSSETHIETAKREGLGNANLLLAEYLLIACGKFEATYDLEKRPSLEVLERYRIPTVPQKYGKAPKYKYIKGGGTFFDLAKANLKDLRDKFQKCHNAIWEGGKRDPAMAFDEMSKLMFAKIYDERFTKDGEPYQFQIGIQEDEDIVGERVKRRYREVQDKEPMVFKDPINVPNNIIFSVVDCLQEISMSQTDLDSKGTAFESFLGKVFRGEYGQFFTPREIVDFMVKFVDPNEGDLVMDPACGSGGFLLYCIKAVRDKIEKNYSNEKERILHDYDFSHDRVFGIEINDRIARVAMMDMVIHDDGHTNIECNDALKDCESFDPRREIKLGKYTLVLTNPPFGARYKKSEKEYFKKFRLAKVKNNKLKNSENSEILFIERCIDFLKPGGILGIVLPDSAFTNKRYIPVVQFILEKTRVIGIVSLPQHAFIPFGSMAKTSILFLKKLEENEQVNDYSIFMAHIERIGYDATLREDKNDFPKVLEEYLTFKKNPENYEGKFYSNELWTVKVMYSQLSNKLDVEAYDREYISTIEEINKLKEKGYAVFPLHKLCKTIFSGVGFGTRDYRKQGIPVIKTRSVKKLIQHVGRVDWSEVDFVAERKYAKDKFLQPLDILVQSVAHSKEYIGDKIAIIDKIPESFGNVLALSKFLVIRADENKVNPIYLFLFLTSKLARKQFKHFIRGMTAEIYEFDIKNMVIPIPDRPTQDKIAEELLQLLENLQHYRTRLQETETKVSNLLEKFY